MSRENGSGPTRHGKASLEGGSFDTFNQNGSTGGWPAQFSRQCQHRASHSAEIPVNAPHSAVTGREGRNGGGNDDYTTIFTRPQPKLGHGVTSDFDFRTVCASFGYGTLAYPGMTSAKLYRFLSFPGRAEQKRRATTHEYYGPGVWPLRSVSMGTSIRLWSRLTPPQGRTADLEPDFR